MSFAEDQNLESSIGSVADHSDSISMASVNDTTAVLSLANGATLSPLNNTPTNITIAVATSVVAIAQYSIHVPNQGFSGKPSAVAQCSNAQSVNPTLTTYPGTVHNPTNEFFFHRPGLGSFECFPALAMELQNMIWQSAVDPRLVIWGPGGTIPGFLLASQESRQETNGILEVGGGKYTKIVLPLRDDPKQGTYSFWIDFEKDFLHRNAKMPKFKELLGPRPEGMKNSMDVSWLHPAQHLSLRTREVYKIILCAEYHGEPGFWLRLKHMVPNLKTLMLVNNRSIQRSDTLADLREVNFINAYLQDKVMMDYIEGDWRRHNDESDLKWANLKIIFMEHRPAVE